MMLKTLRPDPVFFTVFLEKEFLKSVDREKGKFRTFVLASLNHFLSNERKKPQPKKGAEENCR